jgi:hypothetical protein
MYQLTTGTSIKLTLPTGSTLFLPAENNGTPEWREYQAWLDAGNTPEPAPEPPAPAHDYWAFWDALAGSGMYAAIREQALASLPMTVQTTELIALLNDAKLGRPNEAAIGASMVGILTTGTFTATHLGELQAALAAGNLTDVYPLPGG